ncbi:MAG: TlpA family protein disulfide reductase [Chitinophagaceae bacterium]|nr:TlpA family protein disulfide reductase [Chitinophagaceae bacterium]
MRCNVKKQSAFLCAMLLIILAGASGQGNYYSPLKKGSEFPDLSFVAYKGNASNTISLKDYRNKIILLDFWGVFCGTCVADLPHLLELQRQFKDEIQIIVVTKNSKNEVDALWREMKSRSANPAIAESAKHLPFIVSDSILGSLFPYVGIPMHVWIGKNNEYLSSSYSYSTTKENIRALIEGKPVRFPPYTIKEFNPLNFKYKAWLDKRISSSDNLISFSMLTKFDPTSQDGGLTDFLKDTSTNQITGISDVNRDLNELYRLAYFKRINVRHDYLVLETDKDRFFPPENIGRLYEWLENNKFCYVSKTPLQRADSLFEHMKNDLDNYFGLQSEFENRKLRCLILKRMGSKDLIRTKGGEPKSQVFHYSNNKAELVMQNMTVADLTDEIAGIIGAWARLQRTSIPFFNETDYAGNIDIKLPWGYDPPPSDWIEKLRFDLQKIGLDLVEEEREFKVLVIKDN